MEKPNGNITVIACAGLIGTCIVGICICIQIIADAVINGVSLATSVYK